MQKISSLSLLPALALGAAGEATAQSKNFEGFGISIGAANQEVNVKSSSGTSSAWKTSGNLELTHFKSLDDNWLLGFGVGLDVGKLGSVGSGSSSVSYYNDNGISTCSSFVRFVCYEYTSGASRSSFKDNVSLSVIPAYAFNKNNLGFIRLSFNSMRSSKSSSAGGWTGSNVSDACNDLYGPISPDCPAESGSGNSGSKRLKGWGLGVGYRYQSDSNWFLQAEVKYTPFRKDDYLDIKPTLAGAVLSVGYRY